MGACGLVCGCKSWEQVALYGRKHADWLGTFLGLPHGIPSKSTFRRVFARIKPSAFERCFRTWTQGLAATLGIKHIAIDGKTLRRSHDRGAGTTALHLVSAWAADHRLSLGQFRLRPAQILPAPADAEAQVAEEVFLVDVHT